MKQFAMNKIVVIYTFSPFPSGDANANRMYAMALSMQSAGYKIIILTPCLPTEADLNADTGKYEFNTIEYRSYYKPGLSRLGGIKNRYNISRIINSTMTSTEIEKICLVCSSYLNYNVILHLYLKKHKIPALVDATEWYSSFQFKFGKFNRNYLLHDISNRILIPKAKNVICVSRYLEDYYRKKGCNTLYLPPQIVSKDYDSRHIKTLSPVVFIYAGSIQTKNDFIGLAIEGFSMLTSEEKEKIKIIIVGPDKKSLLHKLPQSKQFVESLGNSLQIKGRIAKQDVQEYLSNSHFMFFLRPKARYSAAGFPSKVPEALASGVPVITNLTSDLNHYIVDGQNGLVVKELSATGFLETVRRAIKMSSEDYSKMSNSAQSTALSQFDYTNFNGVVRTFLENSVLQ